MNYPVLKTWQIITLQLLLLGGFTIINLGSAHEQEVEYERQLERYEFYDQAYNLKYGYNRTNWRLTGVYYHDDFYCVSVKDRTPEEIQTTEYHEACHHLVQEQPDHFCRGYCKKVGDATK